MLKKIKKPQPHIETLSLRDIFRKHGVKKIQGEYVTAKEAALMSGLIGVPVGLAGLSVLPFLAMDPTGTLLILSIAAPYVLGGAGLTGAGYGLGRLNQNKIAKKTVTLKNFAGQKVTGTFENVLALHCLQEELLKLIDTSDRRKSTIANRMQEIIPNVKCDHGIKYRIISTQNDIKQFDLQDHVAQLKAITGAQIRKTNKALGKK